MVINGENGHFGDGGTFTKTLKFEACSIYFSDKKPNGVLNLNPFP
jgi:hypothetical protein